MNNFDEYFEGYKVPERIKNTTIAIMRRFTITGLCDGMYISNVIAHTCGIGDGQGNFTSNEITNIGEIAVNLQCSYGCNIFKRDLRELENILETGSLNKSQAIIGLNEYIAVCQSEKKACDEWRIKYLEHCINNAKETIQELETQTKGGFPELHIL